MSFSKVVAITALLAFAGTSASAERAKGVRYEMVADGEVQIALDGHVSDYRLASELAPEIAALVNRSVRRWRFQPILQDGQPVTAKTALQIRLSAESAADKPDSFVVRVIGVEFGAPSRRSANHPPRYPGLAISARLNAKVVLLLRIDDAGKVVEARPYQTSLGARTRSERDAEAWRKIFERESIAAAKTWKYDLTEAVGGRRVGRYALAPIEFRLVRPAAGSERLDKWKGYIPGPVHELPSELGLESDATDRASRLADGEAAALDSHFRLIDDVVGKVL